MNQRRPPDLSETNWVFGYGSLIWRPGFEYTESAPALLGGAHRSLCVFSHRYRGTPDSPGLVFGLEPGGLCHGVAFQVAPEKWPDVCDYLWEREQVSGVYRPSVETVQLAGGRSVSALTFLADAEHGQYAGGLDLGEQVRLVRSGIGHFGSNIDYVLNTAKHLDELGIEDDYLSALVARLNQV